MFIQHGHTEALEPSSGLTEPHRPTHKSHDSNLILMKEQLSLANILIRYTRCKLTFVVADPSGNMRSLYWTERAPHFELPFGHAMLGFPFFLCVYVWNHFGMFDYFIINILKGLYI